MQSISVAGRIGSDATIRSTSNGDQVVSFSVAVDTRKGQEKVTNWWRVSFWGKRAAAVQPYLLKSVPVAVTGEFQLDEFDGKPQLNIRANDVTLLGSRSGGQSESRGGSGNAIRDKGGWGAQDDGFDQDEIPPF